MLIFFPRLLFLWHVLRIVEIRVVEEVGSRSFSYVKKDTKSKCRMVVFFIKIYKQVILRHECIVSPVQSASGKVLHCAWHFHRRNSSVLSYIDLMVELWIGTMALQNLQQYGCQTGNKLKEKSYDLNRNSSRFFLK
jgi:hypothetical protein